MTVNIGINHEKMGRDNSLNRMERKLVRARIGLERIHYFYIYPPAIISCCVFFLPKQYFVAGFWCFVGTVCLLVLHYMAMKRFSSKIMPKWFLYTNADLFLQEMRSYGPKSLDDFETLRNKIKEKDFNGKWLGDAEAIIDAERRILCNLE